jgi:hypothetical protein
MCKANVPSFRSTLCGTLYTLAIPSVLITSKNVPRGKSGHVSRLPIGIRGRSMVGCMVGVLFLFGGGVECRGWGCNPGDVLPSGGEDWGMIRK